MTFNFTPIGEQSDELKVPYYEDARADTAPYYASTRSVDAAKQEVLNKLLVLGATGYFQEGDFSVSKQKRRGYVLHFVMNGARGRMVVAGLPIQSMTPAKLDKVRVQALLNLADWLKGAITTKVFSPGMNPLIPFMLVDETRTVADMVNGGQSSLLLPAPVKSEVRIEVMP